MNAPMHDLRTELAGSRLEQAAAPALVFHRVTKAFGPTLAVNHVSFDVRAGEVHALVGENGAGKSTLIRILAGDHQPDSGSILLSGVAVKFSHPFAALESGIGFVHQIPMYVADLSVTENLRLGSRFLKTRVGLIDWSAEHTQAGEVLSQVGLSIDPRRRLGDLGPAERQLVAVARSLQRNPSVLVFDEVTASLTEPEVTIVHEQICRLRDRGIAIIYVSHRLEEIFSIGDRVSVMRDGRHIITTDIRDLTHRALVGHIVGSDVGDLYAAKSAPQAASDAPSRLELVNVGDTKLQNLNLKVGPGEIVGVAGLGGSGRSRLLRMIFGESEGYSGEIRVDGKSCRFRSALDAIEAGVGLVTEDRMEDGFVSTLPIWKNVTLPWSSAYSTGGVLNLRKERRAALQDAGRVTVKMPSIDALMAQLSGGNQQKAIFARWVSSPVKLLLLDEPTHGVDIGSKSQIYDIIRSLTQRGVSVLLVSSDLEELVGLSDRVVVLSHRRFQSELTGEDISKDRILHNLLEEEETP